MSLKAPITASRPNRRPPGRTGDSSTLGRAAVFPPWFGPIMPARATSSQAGLADEKTHGWSFRVGVADSRLGGFQPRRPGGRVQDCRIATQTVTLDNGVLHYNRAGTGRPSCCCMACSRKKEWNDFPVPTVGRRSCRHRSGLAGYGQSLAFPWRRTHSTAKSPLHQFVDRLGLARFGAGRQFPRRHDRGALRPAASQHVHTPGVRRRAAGDHRRGPRVKAAFHQASIPSSPLTLRSSISKCVCCLSTRPRSRNRSKRRE